MFSPFLHFTCFLRKTATKREISTGWHRWAQQRRRTSTFALAFFLCIQGQSKVPRRPCIVAGPMQSVPRSHRPRRGRLAIPAPDQGQKSLQTTESGARLPRWARPLPRSCVKQIFLAGDFFLESTNRYHPSRLRLDRYKYLIDTVAAAAGNLPHGQLERQIGILRPEFLEKLHAFTGPDALVFYA